MRVDPAVVDAAAQQSRDLGARWRTAAGDVEPETTAAIGSLGTGCRLRAELERILSAHTAEARLDERHLNDLAEALSATAADYRRSDTDAGNRFWYLKDR